MAVNLAAIRARRAKIQRRKRRPPPQRQPDAIRMSYFAALRRLLLRAREILQEELLNQLPRLLSLARGEVLADSAFVVRIDADGPKRIKEAVDRAVARFSQEATGPRLERLARKVGEDTGRFHEKELNKQLRATLGIELPVFEPKMQARLDLFTERNVAYIETISTKYFDGVKKLVLGAVETGQRHEELAKEIKDLTGVAESDAKRVARDQVGKFFGALNQVRQQDLGINTYIWRTSQDNRVREEHEAREGKVFSWDDPPEDGHPGQPIQCRCYPEPNIQAFLEEIR